MAVYNFGNGVLSAAGHKAASAVSEHCRVVNVALNLFFVIQCHMAALVWHRQRHRQWLSALLIMRHLMSQKDACRVHLKKLCIDKAPPSGC